MNKIPMLGISYGRYINLNSVVEMNFCREIIDSTNVEIFMSDGTKYTLDFFNMQSRNQFEHDLTLRCWDNPMVTIGSTDFVATDSRKSLL